jgi:hypothetical protein
VRKNIGTPAMLADAPLEPRVFPCFFFDLEIED